MFYLTIELNSLILDEFRIVMNGAETDNIVIVV